MRDHAFLGANREGGPIVFDRCHDSYLAIQETVKDRRLGIVPSFLAGVHAIIGAAEGRDAELHPQWRGEIERKGRRTIDLLDGHVEQLHMLFPFPLVLVGGRRFLARQGRFFFLGHRGGKPESRQDARQNARGAQPEQIAPREHGTGLTGRREPREPPPPKALSPGFPPASIDVAQGPKQFDMGAFLSGTDEGLRVQGSGFLGRRSAEPLNPEP